DQRSLRVSGARSGIACGGAARSPLWMQLLADVTGLRLRVPATPEPGALGAAILGGVGAGMHQLDEAQARMTRYSRVYSPDAASSALYDLRYKRYCQLDDLLMPWFQEAQQ
ncbi:MAG TPA: FGGY-family carbohydrate kinase, partial [Chloroflexota bacterium]|nr:FGGY-family carbohydrate kinase [Chloroflexota bacterium]